MARKSGRWKPKATPKEKKKPKWADKSLDLGDNCGHSITYVRDGIRKCSWCNQALHAPEAPEGTSDQSSSGNS